MFMTGIWELLPDRLSDDIIFTPYEMVREELNKLPKEVWNDKTIFLDPECKNGIFLYEAHAKLMESDDLIKKFPNDKERSEHICKTQLFGIAPSDMSCMISQRTVYGSVGKYNNIKYVENYFGLLSDKSNQTISSAIKNIFGQIRFDIIISKPTNQQIEEWKLMHKA